MRKLLTTIALGLATASAVCAATFEPIWLPGNWPTNTWWTNVPPLSSIVASNAFFAINENFTRASNSFSGLSAGPVYATNVIGLADAQTNAILNSLRSPAIVSNSVSISAGATNIMGWVTNLAGVEYTVTSGNPQLCFSFDGTNWVLGNSAFVTNVPVRVAFGSGTKVTGDPPVQIPWPATLESVTAYRMDRPDLFGRTNAMYGERLFVSEPRGPTEAASKNYVDETFNATAWWSAGQDVQLNGHALNLSSVWKFYGTQTNDFRLSWLGLDTIVVTQPPPVPVTNTPAVSIDGTGTNVVVTVATNGLTSSLRLQCSQYLTPLNWQFLTTTPVLTGTNYVFTFPMPYPDSGFLAALIPSASNGVVAISADLAVSGVISGDGSGLTNLLANDAYGVASTNWVNQQLASIGVYLYSSGVTNPGSLAGRTNNWLALPQPTLTVTTNSLANLVSGQYIRQLVSSNTFTRVEAGVLNLEAYMYRSGNASGTLLIHPELYLYDTVNDTLFHEFTEGESRTITSTLTDYTYNVPITAVTHTNPMKLVIAWKMDATMNAATVLHFVNGGIYDSHATLPQNIASATIDGSQVQGAVAQATHATNADVASAVSGTLTNNTTGNAATASGGWPEHIHLVCAYASPGIAPSSATPFYMPLSGGAGSTTEASVSIPFGPAPWTATNLYVKILTSLGANTNATITLMTNGVATGLVATIAGGATTGNSSTTSANIPTNATVSLRGTCNVVNGSKAIWQWTLELR